MTGYTRWSDIRDEEIARAGGEAAVEAGKAEMLAVNLAAALLRLLGGRGRR